MKFGTDDYIGEIYYVAKCWHLWLSW